jgi:cytochrome P450
MLNTDPPEHARLRSPANRVFNARAIERLQPRIQAIVDELLDQMDGAHNDHPIASIVDIIGDFASPLAIRILAELLAIPDDDRRNFHQLTQIASGNLDPLATPDVQRTSSLAGLAMADYFARLVAARRKQPGSDFLSRLLEAVDAQELLTTDEIVTMCNLLVIGGYEPLVHLIGNGLLALLQHPDQLRLLQADPSLLAGAVEELLRFDSPIQLAARMAVEDVEMDGHVVRAGQPVVILIGAANHDPALFPNPEGLDLSRSPNPHLSLGAGAHLCLGAPLVRLVGQTALGALIQRYPHMQMVDARPEWCPSLVPRGLKSLAVRLHS